LILVDTGPLVALLNEDDSHHGWSSSAFKKIGPRIFTCQAVLTEACFLLGRRGRYHDLLRQHVLAGHIVDAFDFRKSASVAFDLMERYRNVPMSFADACLVAMSQTLRDAKICTLDRDFQIYRQHGDQPLNLLSPFEA
jgi:predicted nucleic acid-binding protein